MTKRKKLLIAAGFFFTLLATLYVAYPIWAFNKIDIEYIVGLCMQKPESSLYPDSITEMYMLTFRGNKNDIERLESGNGLSAIFSFEEDATKQTIKYMTFFLDKGIDINSKDSLGLTSLHQAVLMNQPKTVEFLISKGADPNIKIDMPKHKVHGMTPIEYAKYWTQKDGKDRTALIKLMTEKLQ